VKKFLSEIYTFTRYLQFSAITGHCADGPTNQPTDAVSYRGALAPKN
jgi:hypothetical protein